MAKQPEQRSALAVGFELASRVTTVALGFSVPPLLGFGLDRWWGSTPSRPWSGSFWASYRGCFRRSGSPRELPGVNRRYRRAATDSTGADVSIRQRRPSDRSGSPDQRSQQIAPQNSATSPSPSIDRRGFMAEHSPNPLDHVVDHPSIELPWFHGPHYELIWTFRRSAASDHSVHGDGAGRGRLDHR